MSTNDNSNQNLTNLASPKIGTKIIEAFSDDFFGKANPNDRMIKIQYSLKISTMNHGKVDGWMGE